MEPTPVPAATPNPPPPRAIAIGDVDRIAFSDGRGSVNTVNPDGAELATVARSSLLSGEFHYTFPVWSPDGGGLVFSSFLIVENSVVQSALHRAEADGNGPISHDSRRRYLPERRRPGSTPFLGMVTEWGKDRADDHRRIWNRHHPPRLVFR